MRERRCENCRRPGRRSRQARHAPGRAGFRPSQPGPGLCHSPSSAPPCRSTRRGQSDRAPRARRRQIQSSPKARRWPGFVSCANNAKRPAAFPGGGTPAYFNPRRRLNRWLIFHSIGRDISWRRAKTSGMVTAVHHWPMLRLGSPKQTVQSRPGLDGVSACSQNGSAGQFHPRRGRAGSPRSFASLRRARGNARGRRGIGLERRVAPHEKLTPARRSLARERLLSSRPLGRVSAMASKAVAESSSSVAGLVSFWNFDDG